VVQCSSLRSIFWRVFLGRLSSHSIHNWRAELHDERLRYVDYARKYHIRPHSNSHQKQVDSTHSTESNDDELGWGRGRGSRDPQTESETEWETEGEWSSDGESTRSSSTSVFSLSSSSVSLDLRVHHPLSNSTSSLWFDHHINIELCSTIRLDLTRTYAESPFFSSRIIQELMLHVLFVWAKLNPKYEYRQGQNEILAIVVLVMWRNARKNKKHKNNTDKQKQENENVKDGNGNQNQISNSSGNESGSGSGTTNPDSGTTNPNTDSMNPSVASASDPRSEIGAGAASEASYDLLSDLLDHDYIEHDIFSVFSAIMSVMAPFFAKADPPAKSTAPKPTRNRGSLLFDEPILANRRHGQRNTSASSSSSSSSSSPPPPSSSPSSDSDSSISRPPSESCIVSKCNYLQHCLLSHHDPVLYRHLESHEVAPQLYLLRWYRVLFAREFDIEDVIQIWDVIFSQFKHKSNSKQNQNPISHDSDLYSSSSLSGFPFADYFCISMLCYVRESLLNGMRFEIDTWR